MCAPGPSRRLAREAECSRSDERSEIAKKILDSYPEPDKSFMELRDMARNGTIDLLYRFNMVCREEFERTAHF
jgi:hypothetical protein